jgi:hypothetical protein
MTDNLYSMIDKMNISNIYIWDYLFIDTGESFCYQEKYDSKSTIAEIIKNIREKLFVHEPDIKIRIVKYHGDNYHRYDLADSFWNEKTTMEEYTKSVKIVTSDDDVFSVVMLFMYVK